MKTYQERRSHPMKWVLAVLIFVIVMTFTVNEAFGIWLPKSDGSGSGTNQPQHDRQIQAIDTKNPPPQVPEPGTMVLLGSGIAAMHLLRKRKKAA